MFVFLIAAWACISWLDPVTEMVYVHEWGVIEIDSPELRIQALPDSRTDDFLSGFRGPEMKAPVVWFHGYPCTGDFSVEVYNGAFTTLIPLPESIYSSTAPGTAGSDVSLALWEDLELSDEPVDTTLEGCALPSMRRLMETDEFLQSIPLWRAVPCNSVNYPAGQYSDAFLYYEADLYCTGMFDGDFYGFTGTALYFYPDDGGMACVFADLPFAVDVGGSLLDDADIQETINSWCPGLLPEEIDALWQTWRPLVRRRCTQHGETLLLFPLTQEQTESISTIRFDPHAGFTGVTYHRLFLGLGALEQ